ncbi:hypothetical protein MTZ49_04655 [Entomomonas sp. E2T0]|uniref:hypothetical protein n=1 Tax=Entomomonas sp. E2T0 TaxID=2930213 RepID=UPI00222823A1|nr:hypothetical protein [Entomomonas sp. E2T0]UYZ84861.1 hypothetical protein MTZ49_04655 [Entomomonas sp. E2T0]
MVPNIESSSYPCAELNDIRVRRYFLLHMHQEDFSVNINDIHDVKLFMEHAYNLAKKLLSEYGDEIASDEGHLKERVIKIAKQFLNQKLIPISHFEWLKEDRSCYYTWLSIRCYSYQLPNGTSYFPYINMGLSNQAYNSQERFDLIISFFDLWQISNSEKIQYLDRLKATWSSNLLLKPFKWLDRKNTELCDWLYDYLKKYCQECNGSTTFQAHIFNSANKLALQINPINTDEIYHLIYALYDTLNYFAINNLNDKLNKAYSQYKFRKKNKDKKPLNTYLTKETKAKLEKLRTHYNNRTLHDTLDLIIRQAYDNTIINK